MVKGIASLLQEVLKGISIVDWLDTVGDLVNAIYGSLWQPPNNKQDSIEYTWVVEAPSALAISFCYMNSVSPQVTGKRSSLKLSSYSLMRG